MLSFSSHQLPIAAFHAAYSGKLHLFNRQLDTFHHHLTGLEMHHSTPGFEH